MLRTMQDVELVIRRNPDLFRDLDNPGGFSKWLPGNEHIIMEFQRLALELHRRGNRDRYSARAIAHKMRWDSLFTEAGTAYKIGNNPTPFLARLIMAANIELKGMFELRGQKDKDD